MVDRADRSSYRAQLHGFSLFSELKEEPRLWVVKRVAKTFQNTSTNGFEGQAEEQRWSLDLFFDPQKQSDDLKRQKKKLKPAGFSKGGSPASRKTSPKATAGEHSFFFFFLRGSDWSLIELL